MTVLQLEHKIYRYIGLSTDTKPTEDIDGTVTGCTFLESDTGLMFITYDGTNWVKKEGFLTPKEVRTAVVIDASEGAFGIGDVVSNEDCCSTTATYWTFSDVARENGGYFYITGALLISETENQAVQYDLLLFNAAPTGNLVGGLANDNPLKADRSKWLGKLAFITTEANGATVASFTEISPSTPGNAPKLMKCGSSLKDIYGVLVTNTAYTHTDTDDIEITLLVERY